MDKNSIIGVVLIGLILVGYSYLNRPSEEQLASRKRKMDSIARVVEQQKKQAIADSTVLVKQTKIVLDSLQTGQDSTLINNKKQQVNKKYGIFSILSDGKNEYFDLENDKIKIKISSKGGRIVSAIVKGYKTYDSLPVNLINEKQSKFNISFFAGNIIVNTEDLYFKSITKGNNKIILRAAVNDNQYIEYSYDLSKNLYYVNYDIKLKGLDNIISHNRDYISLDWQMNIPKQELGATNENQYTTIYYKPALEDVDYLSERSKEEQEDIRVDIRWVSFKDQFFSSTLISRNDGFMDGILKTKTIYETNPGFIKNAHAELSIPYFAKETEVNSYYFYFGPNKYQILKEYSDEKFTGIDEYLNLEKLIPLGWGIFAWVNKYAIIPIFHFLSSFISNYGLIIFLMTIIIKLVLFPLTYKSYLSTAKMRVLKPQIDEINKKIPKDKPMERQQATMALYKKAGVNPMGGCLPMLLQMPILFAMFRFFPASIELRQQSFLWAHDLSTYDSIFDLPFNIPMYGDHVSLFTLLMTISTLLYTKMQNDMNPSNSSMPGMKTMMYIMPIMFLFFLNNYSSGLTYYYFLANMITFAQMFFIKSRINDEEILRKLETAKKKTPKKPSRFQQRLEEMAKKQQQKRK